MKTEEKTDMIEVLDSWVVWFKKQLKENNLVVIDANETLELIDIFEEIPEELK